MERCTSLKQFLKLTLKLSDQELRDWPTTVKTIDPERKKWLKEAMDGILENQDIKYLKESLETLKDGDVDEMDEAKLDARSKALDTIHDLLDMDHNATDLHLLGGFEVVCRYFKSPVSSLQWRAAEVIAEASQNKPVCQLAAMDAGAIEQLIGMLNSAEADMVKVKSIFALSSITKNCETTIRRFVELNGIQALMNALKDDFEKVKIKAAFLLMNLTFDDDDQAIVSRYVSENLVPLLIMNLKDKHSAAHEHIANLLRDIVSKNKQAVLQCRMPEYGLKKLLLERKGKLQSEDAGKYEEEIGHYDQIVKICFNAS